MFFNRSKKESTKVIIIEDTNLANTELLVSKVVDKVYPKEVLEIHKEFITAADKLVEEANLILVEAGKKDVSKVDRLEKLGFKQANQVTELKPLLKKAELSKEQIKLVNYYQGKYPLNKFITLDQVISICNKYNLIYGDISRFKGFVPNKNLEEIENFKVDKSDISTKIWSIGVHGKYIGEEHEDDGYQASSYSGLYKKENRAEPLLICAPPKDMDLSSSKIQNLRIIKTAPDPVVLQPVKGGYLIVTAWGDEASDELVINNKMN